MQNLIRGKSNAREISFQHGEPHKGELNEEIIIVTFIFRGLLHDKLSGKTTETFLRLSGILQA